jgi:DNA-binding CsgD family transcriptional regulator
MPDFSEPELTDLERGILELLADGVSSRMIADTVGLPRREVGPHIRNVIRKMQEHGMLDAVARGARNSDHPHPVSMDDTELLAHLRFPHQYGVPPYTPFDERRHLPPVAELRRLHDLMHREPPPSTA